MRHPLPFVPAPRRYSRFPTFLSALRLGVAFLTALWFSTAAAGEFNEVLKIGDTAPAWSQLPGTDGKTHSLADLAAKEVVVVIFTSANCPTAVDYEGRIQALALEQGGARGKVAVVPICVNRIEADRLPKLRARVTQKKFAFTYLTDESQQIARNYGAVFTPEFFVLNKERKIVYMGALDDSTDAGAVVHRYVIDAIAATLRGEAPKVRETIARGCRIRYARERN